MKKSDKLSKKEVKDPDFNSSKNLFLIYKENRKLFSKIKKIKKEYNLTSEDFLNVAKKHIPIPISIFKNNSPLESLVKYLKDNIGLSLNEIASLSNRDQRTIWLTYNNATKKITELDISSKITIPLEFFSERGLSILENLVSYLVDQNYSIAKISSLLNRDYKTIWTIYNRFKKKDARSS